MRLKIPGKTRATALLSITLPSAEFGSYLPTEDVVLCGENYFCIADGVTRDTGLDVSRYKITPKHLQQYPLPSGAMLVAEAFSSIFQKTIEHGSTVRGAFVKANSAIKKINNQSVPSPDYLVNDYYACVAVGAHLVGNILHWGVLGDCGLIIYNREGRVKFRTHNPQGVFEDYAKMGKIVFDWNVPKDRIFIRKTFRNKPLKTVDGVRVSFGALTGETEAVKFLYTGEYRTTKGDSLIFYSDGFKPLIDENDFFALISQSNPKNMLKKLVDWDASLVKKNIKRYGKERSLIVVRV